jgi:hypothetical protein
MILNEVIWHNGNAYKILKKIKQHSVSPKNILNKGAAWIFEKKNINLVKINYQKLYENFVKDFDKEIYLDNILDIALVKGPKAFKI